MITCHVRGNHVSTARVYRAPERKLADEGWADAGDDGVGVACEKHGIEVCLKCSPAGSDRR
jgi:hypothetical protein